MKYSAIRNATDQLSSIQQFKQLYELQYDWSPFYSSSCLDKTTIEQIPKCYIDCCNITSFTMLHVHSLSTNSIANINGVGVQGDTHSSSSAPLVLIRLWYTQWRNSAFYLSLKCVAQWHRAECMYINYECIYGRSHGNGTTCPIWKHAFSFCVIAPALLCWSYQIISCSKEDWIPVTMVPVWC